eukprot:Gb_27887 [translate_table: standard]
MSVTALEISRKRERDEDSSPDHRFESLSVEVPQFLKRPCQDWALSDFLHDAPDAGFTGENFDPVQEELISDVMKSLEEEIKCKSACVLELDEDISAGCNKGDCSGDNAAEESCGCGPSVSDSASSITGSVSVGGSEDRSNVNIEYLLEATDDELGIPSSPHDELKIFGKDISGNPNANPSLLDNYPSETEALELLQLCRGDCWYESPQEPDTEIFNDVCSQDWLTRSLNADLFDDSYAAMDQYFIPISETGVGL